MHAGLHLDRVGKSFGDIKAIDNLSFDVNPGEVVAITGPSGAGKTTSNRLIAGLEQADSGTIFIDGRDVTDLPPQERHVSVMFESFALYPLMSVVDNIEFSLRSPTVADRYDDARISKCIDEVLELTEMGGLRDRMPHELSGGQKQRVALCRALAVEPQVYLMDEPIAHLDAKLRHKLRGELRRRLVASQVPTLWYTPDSMEALSVADRVAVLVEGRLHQFDTPEIIYTQPATIDVARLVGDPGMNLLPGSLVHINDVLHFRTESISLKLSDEIRIRLEARSKVDDVVLGIRATDIEVAENETGDTCRAEVYSFEPFGKYEILTIKFDGSTIKAKLFKSIKSKVEDVMNIRLCPENATLFDSVTEKAI
jgi:multiple sugar transport system ATP-binding protein